jgi:hypothetical protein
MEMNDRLCDKCDLSIGDNSWHRDDYGHVFHDSCEAVHCKITIDRLETEKVEMLLELMKKSKPPLTCAMSNVLAWKLGETAMKAGNPNRKDVGDLIDRGLILCRMLEEAGFELRVIPNGKLDYNMYNL